MNNSEMISVFNRYNSLYNKLKLKICKKYEITKTSFDILMSLYTNEDLKTADNICTYYGLKPPIVSIQVEKLIQANYLEKIVDINDRRKHILTLTEKSIPIVKDGDLIQQYYFDKIFLGIGSNNILEFCSV